MGPISKRHSIGFDLLTASPPEADRLIRRYLGNLSGGLTARQGLLQPVRFTGQFLDTSEADRLYEFERLDFSPALVFALLEHKSTVDFGTPLQLFGYMHRIWTWYRERPGGDRTVLPPIIPLVFYHGASDWTVPRSVPEMIHGSDALAEFARSLAYRMFDLKHIPFAELAPDVRTRAGLGLLKHSSRGVLPPDEGPQILREIDSLPPDSQYLTQLLTYIDDVYKLTPADLAKLWPGDGSQTRESIMPTLAEHWAEEGRIEGRAEGQAAGQAAGRATTLLRQLERRFGPVPQTVAARVRTADIGALDVWLDAVLDAKTIDDVFEDRSLR